jgi:hypothetical protein
MPGSSALAADQDKRDRSAKKRAVDGVAISSSALTLFQVPLALILLLLAVPRDRKVYR